MSDDANIYLNSCQSRFPSVYLVLSVFRDIWPPIRKILVHTGKRNAKSQRFSFAISQIAALPPVVALNRSSPNRIGLFPLVPLNDSQRFKSQRLQDADATKSQTLAF